MAALKSGTADLHRRIEAQLAIGERFARRDTYVAHLARLATFHISAETQWAHLLRPALVDFAARCKSSLLRRDLDYLNGGLSGQAELPVVEDTAAALGAFYVLEGATLGGQHLCALVHRKLGLDAEHGAAYLASYGSEVQSMWLGFGRQVDAYCRDQTFIASAVAAARATFIALADHLGGVSA